MSLMVLLSDETSNIMTFAELKFNLEKCRKCKFVIGLNVVKWGISEFIDFYWIPVSLTTMTICNSKTQKMQRT